MVFYIRFALYFILSTCHLQLRSSKCLRSSCSNAAGSPMAAFCTNRRTAACGHHPISPVLRCSIFFLDHFGSLLYLQFGLEQFMPPLSDRSQHFPGRHLRRQGFQQPQGISGNFWDVKNHKLFGGGSCDSKIGSLLGIDGGMTGVHKIKKRVLIV